MTYSSLLACAAAVLALPALAADGPKQSFQETHTERLDIPPGGTVHIDNSYGYLTVEGWDQPRVEVTVTKTTDRYYAPSHQQKEEQRFAEIRVVADRPKRDDVAITTTLPPRKGGVNSVIPFDRMIVIRSLLPRNHRGVTVDCRVRVPRDARLIVRHDYGYVWVSDVSGDLEIDSHTGDMIVMLPEPGPYAIDARTRLGSISSDFAGNGHKQLLIGTHFTYPGPESHQVRLRMGRGNITLKEGGPPNPIE